MKTAITFSRWLKGVLPALLLVQAPVLLFSLPAQAEEKQAVSIPSSLEGYSITFDLSEAKPYATGSTGMQHAIETKFKDYKSWDWQNRKLSADAIWFAKVNLNKDDWKSGVIHGKYNVEKINEKQLFVNLMEETGYTRRAFLLLDFTDGQSGIAIWGEEDAFVGNIKFTLKKVVAEGK